MDMQLLLNLGKTQIAAMFNRQVEGWTIDDSEFLPLVEDVLTAFETTGVAQEVIEELWEYAYDVFDQHCRAGDPDSTTEDNRRLMQNYLLRRDGRTR